MAAARENFIDPRATTTIGCDVASGHGEAVSCIVVRRGLDARSVQIRRFANLDPVQFAYKVAVAAREHNADAVFVDAGGLGIGCVGKLRELNVPNVHAIEFGGKSDNPSGLSQAGNKRAELWLAMARWLKEGGTIPDDEQLKAELTAPTFTEGPRGILIEAKDSMRRRGLAPTDSADALALTFAYPTFSEATQELLGAGDHQVLHEYNPFDSAVMDAMAEGRPLPQSRARYTAPGYRLKPEWTHEGGWTGDDWADAHASDELRKEIWNEPE
jgi:hypothetical protein